MLKYIIFGFLCSFNAYAQPQIVNYVTPEQKELGSAAQDGVQTIVIEDDFMADLDLIASKHGDEHAMGTLANSCLRKKDYTCAYQWAGIALRGYYWKQNGAEDKLKDIQKTAKENLSAENIADLDKVIREYKPRP